MLVMAVTFEVEVSRYEEFAVCVNRTMLDSQQEPGCVLYQFTADLQSRGRFHLFELWESEQAHQTHLGGEAFKRFSAVLSQCGRVATFQAWQGALTPYERKARKD